MSPAPTSQPPRHPDVVIVGAGAAGIAASHLLSAAGVSHAVLERAARVGGRGLTDHSLGLPVDLGCHWLHAATRNPYGDLAIRYGHRFSRTNLPRRFYRGGGGARPLDGVETPAREAFIARAEDHLDRIGRSGPDLSVAQVLPPSWRDEPWGESLAGWVRVYTGAEPEDVSVIDWANYDSEGGNWPVTGGYGALIARHARGLPIRTNCAVTAIDWRDGESVRVETAEGTIHARACILTLSPPALLRLAMRPGLPAETQAAAEGLPLGQAEVAAMRIDGRGLGDTPFAAILDREPTCYVRVHPVEGVAAGFFGGRQAEALAREGPQALMAALRTRLRDLFGSDSVHGDGAGVTSGWSTDPGIGGAYSAARPGRGDDRRTFGRPIAERVLLAGEATADRWATTVHGAHFSGERAAREALAVLCR